jgi:hypothetical protein
MDNIMAWTGVSVKKIRQPASRLGQRLRVGHGLVKQSSVLFLFPSAVIFEFFWVASLIDSRHRFLFRVILKFGLF